MKVFVSYLCNDLINLSLLPYNYVMYHEIQHSDFTSTLKVVGKI
jgi:hypothetical protein